jgi:magnesium-transporting ATPase (P-type)
MTVIVAILTGLTLPLTPVQILWINMVTAVGRGLTIFAARVISVADDCSS